MAKEVGYVYAVWRDDDWISLIRYNSEGVETFYGDTGGWERTPNKDNMLTGGGDFVWYDEITPEEAGEVAVEIVRKYRKKEAEKK